MALLVSCVLDPRALVFYDVTATRATLLSVSDAQKKKSAGVKNGIFADTAKTRTDYKREKCS